MDEMHVSLINLELNSGDFEKYEFNPGENDSIQLGINFTEFVKLLKVSSGHDYLTIRYNSSEPKLNIIFSNDGLIRKYSLMLLDTDTNNINVPSIDYYLELELSTKLFTNIVNSVIATGAEEITFKIANNKLVSSSKGDLSETEFVFDKSEGYENETKLKLNFKKKTNETKVKKRKIYELLSCEGQFNVTVGMSMLKNIVKANMLTDYVTLNMIENNPVRLDYTLNDDGSVIYYYISPKIDD
jgi:proliferating cell nuclear antigen PCNA